MPTLRLPMKNARSLATRCKVVALLVVLNTVVFLFPHRTPSAPSNRRSEAHPVDVQHHSEDSPGLTKPTVRRVAEEFARTPLSAAGLPGEKTSDDPLSVLLAANPAASAALQCRSAPESSARMDPVHGAGRNEHRYAKCFWRAGAKFMYFGNNWGRHFNQMTVETKKKYEWS